MDILDALRAAGALILVLGIILGLSWALRRYGATFGLKTGPATSDLRVIEWRTLDVRRKLAVVRWDGRDHLLVLGPAGDCVVAERRVADASASSASAPSAANDEIKG